MSELVTAACRNCGAPASGKYCPECGQETAPHPPTAGEFLHEFVGHYIALEGALWRTLKQLAVPGRLTNEYFAGRKRRYVLPLRLYLTASVVFFLASKVIGPDVPVSISSSGGAAGNAPVEIHCNALEVPCQKIKARIKERHGELSQRQLAQLVTGKLVSEGPYAMFFLLPVFALLTRAAYRRRPFNYGEHLVFALHVHAFAFFVGALVAPLHVPLAMIGLTAIYLAVAMWRVFGGRMWPLVLRFLFVAITYLLLVTLTISAIGMAALFL